MSVTETLRARDFPPCSRLRKRLFSQLLWSPGKEPERQTSQSVLHQIIQQALITSSLLSLPQAEPNFPSQGTEGPEMLQTGRSLWLEGGHRIRGAWSVCSDPQRNSLVIVLRELEGKVAEVQLWIVSWLESALSLGKSLSMEHWSLSTNAFARLWRENRGISLIVSKLHS